VFAGEIKGAGLFPFVTELHGPEIVQVKELKGIYEGGFTGVVRSDDLQGTRDFDFGVFVTAGVDKDYFARSVWHGLEGRVGCRSRSGTGCLGELDAAGEDAVEWPQKSELVRAEDLGPADTLHLLQDCF